MVESTRTSEDVIFPDFQRRSDYFLEPESADATASFVIEKYFAEPQVIEERYNKNELYFNRNCLSVCLF